MLSLHVLLFHLFNHVTFIISHINKIKEVFRYVHILIRLVIELYFQNLYVQFNDIFFPSPVVVNLSLVADPSALLDPAQSATNTVDKSTSQAALKTVFRDLVWVCCGQTTSSKEVMVGGGVSVQIWCICAVIR